jgi:hypothetical protein
MPRRRRRISEMRFRSGRRGFVRTRPFTVARFLRQAHRTLPHHLRLPDMAGICKDQSLVVRDYVLHSPFAASQVEFAFHSGLVLVQEGEVKRSA